MSPGAIRLLLEDDDAFPKRLARATLPDGQVLAFVQSTGGTGVPLLVSNELSLAGSDQSQGD